MRRGVPVLGVSVRLATPSPFHRQHTANSIELASEGTAGEAMGGVKQEVVTPSRSPASSVPSPSPAGILPKNLFDGSPSGAVARAKELLARTLPTQAGLLGALRPPATPVRPKLVSPPPKMSGAPPVAAALPAALAAAASPAKSAEMPAPPAKAAQPTLACTALAVHAPTAGTKLACKSGVPALSKVLAMGTPPTALDVPNKKAKVAAPPAPAPATPKSVGTESEELVRAVGKLQVMGDTEASWQHSIAALALSRCAVLHRFSSLQDPSEMAVWPENYLERQNLYATFKRLGSKPVQTLGSKPVQTLTDAILDNA